MRTSISLLRPKKSAIHSWRPASVRAKDPVPPAPIMSKTSQLSLVAIVGAIIGACLMWVAIRDRTLVREPERANPELSSSTKPSRSGVPERFQDDGPVVHNDLPAGKTDRAEFPSGRHSGASLGKHDSSDRSIDGAIDAKPPNADTPPRFIAMTTLQRNVISSPILRSASQRPNASSPNGNVLGKALAFALEAARPYVERGFALRDEYWAAPVQNSGSAVRHSLFRGNEYWFFAATDVKQSRISIHVYDAEGKLTEAEDWQKSNVAGARVKPAKTGEHYIIISAKPDPDSQMLPAPPQLHWAIAYAYR
jgi:hypothetical protein